MVFEKSPHQLVGRDVPGGFAQEPYRRLLPWPGVTHALDGDEDDLALVLAATVGRDGGGGAVLGLVEDPGRQRLVLAAIGFDPSFYRVVHDKPTDYVGTCENLSQCRDP